MLTIFQVLVHLGSLRFLLLLISNPIELYEYLNENTCKVIRIVART